MLSDFMLYLRGLLARFEILLLPFRHFPGQRHFHRRHFVLGTARGPILKLRSDDVGASESMMERGVNHARLHALRNASVQCRVAGAAGERHPIALANAAILGVERMNLE